MPRRLRKRNVYEEVARLLDIPGGEQIVKESYAQMRKFNCWNISIVQQYGRFKESRIRSAVFGNSRQFFLMRQNDRADLDDMAADIGLTELTNHAILSYLLPDQQKGEKFSAFTYLHNDAQNPTCGTAHNVASPEMLYISGSSGAQFDQRAEALRGSNDVVARSLRRLQTLRRRSRLGTWYAIPASGPIHLICTATLPLARPFSRYASASFAWSNREIPGRSPATRALPSRSRSAAGSRRAAHPTHASCYANQRATRAAIVVGASTCRK